jgi:site-specific DNA-cytosine methylase
MKMPTVNDPLLTARLEAAAAGSLPPGQADAAPRAAVSDPGLVARLEGAAQAPSGAPPYTPNEFERIWSGIKTGFVSVGAGAAQAFLGAEAANPPRPMEMAYQQRGAFSSKVSGMYSPEPVRKAFADLHDDAYEKSAEQVARELAEWTNAWMQNNSPADPKYRDSLYSAIGSMAAIAGPAAVMGLLSGPQGAQIGAAVVESAAEQGSVERELIAKYGMSAAEAHEKSLWVFAVNLPMNFVLDKGLFRALPGGELSKKLAAAVGAKAIARVIAIDAGIAAAKEAIQETGQEVVSTKAVGDKQDLGRLFVAGSTGAIVGGLMTGAGAVTTRRGGGGATAPLEDDSPAPDGFDVYQEPVDDAQAAPGETQEPTLVQSPAQMEVPAEAPVGAPAGEAPSAPVAEPVPEPVPTPAQPEIAPEAAARDLQAEIRAQTQREEAALRAKYQPTPGPAAAAPDEAPAAEPDDDTRGSGVQYHGTMSPLTGPLKGMDSDFYSPGNIYGQGFYTTDAADAARGYSNKMGKSKTATVYRVAEKPGAKIYDMDAPLDALGVDALKEFRQSSLGEDAYDEATDGGKRVPSLREVMDAARGLSRDYRYSTHDVQDIFNSITWTISEAGYDGMTHEGGRALKKVKPHKVVIYFNPADSVTLTEVKGKIAREAAVESAPPEPAAVAEPAGSPAVPVEAAPAPAPIAAIEREAKKGKKPKAPANYDLLPMPDINTDPERYQVRSDGSAVGVDEEFVADAVANYDPQAVNPIEVWKDPKDGKFYVIDGHHTREIESRVGKKQAVVKVFTGTEAEAIAASKKRNDQRRGNDIIAQAGVIRDLRATGATKKAIAAEAKSNYRQNAPTVLALSHLNPAGRLMDAMRLFKGASDVAANDLLKIAKWIGEVRGRNPNLTDAHEGEMFDYLRKQMGEASAKNEPEFIRYIEDRIGGLGMFDYTKALNLNNAASRTPAQATYDSELAEAKRAKREADATLKAKNDEFTAAMNREETPNDKPITEEQKIKLLVPYEEAVAAANRVVMNLEARKNEINRSGSSEPGLFKILPSQRKQFSLVADRYKARGITKDMQIAEGEVGPEASLIRQVAQRLGAKVVFFRSAEMKNGRIVGGFYNSASKTIFLNLDAVSREPLLMIAMHELGHHMQHNHPAQWRQMYFVALDNISASAKAAHEAYKASLGYTPDQYAGELMSDIMEEASTRESFWSRLADEHPTAFANAVAKIKDIVAAIKAVFSSNPQFKLSKHLKSVERMDAAIANAMRVAADRTAAGQQEKATGQKSMFKNIGPWTKARIATWFSGTGTVEAALAGASSVHAVEYTPEIMAQFNEAHDTEYTASDVTKISPHDVADSDPDHFHASPVCKNFSKAKRSRDPNDIDIASAQAVAGVIRESGVPSITVENVQDYRDTEPYKIITEALTDAGYTWDVVEHDAADYGAAQSRKRLLVRAVKGGKLPPLPSKQAPGDWFSLVEDLIASAPESEIPTWESERIEAMKARGSLDGSKPIITMGGSAGKSVAAARNSGGPAPTLKATPKEVPRIIMPDGRVVKVTPRMMARLMGLPDTFSIPEHFGFAKTVLGNGIHGSVTEALIQPLVNMAGRENNGVEFKVLPPANGKQEMAKRQAALDAAKKRIAAKRRRWTEYPRVVYQRFQDKNTWEWVREKAALKAIGIDIYDYDRSLLPSFQIQRFKGWADKATFALKGAVMSWDNNTVLSESYESIIKRFRLADAIESGEFGQFMIAARRVSDYDEFGDAYFGEPELADGSPNPEYEAAREEFAADEAIYAEYGTPQWIEAAEALTKWSNAMKERGLQGGYLSQEQYDGMVEKHRIYAPMKVLEMEEENASGQSSGPRPTAGRMTWRMDRLIPGLVRQDPMESLVKDAYRLEYLWHNNDAKLGLTDFIKTVHKLTTGKKGNSIPGIGRRVSPKTNPVTRRVADMLKAAGLSDAQQQELVDSGMLDDLEAQAKLWVSSTYMEKNVMAVMRDGEVEYWELDPDIFAIYSNLKGKAAHQMMSFFTMQTKLLRAGVTLTPEFMARNPARDMMNAAILATSLVRTQKIIGPLEVVRPDDVLMLPLRVMRGLAYSIEGRYGDVIPDVARKAMRMQGDPGDLWMRFVMGGAGGGNFVSFDQEGLQKHLDELTRSSRGAGGRAAHTIKNPKYILKSHPLYVLQEFSKLTENSTRLAVLQATHDDLVSKGVSDTEAWARAIQQAREASTDFGRSGEYGRFINMVVPFFNASVQGNDKVIRTLFVDKGNRSAAWARATAMITLPSVLLWALNHDEEWYKEKPAWLKNHCWLFSLDGGKTVIMLPKPFELGMFFGSFPERFLDWAYDHDKKSVGEWATQYVKDVAVADPGSLGGPLVTTAVEVDRNYDAYRGTPIVKGWMQDVIPKEQYTESTTEFAKWLGQSFPGRGLSPLMIDHFVRGATGGVGVYAEKMASAIIMEANPDIKGRKPTPRMAFWKIPEDAPFVKAFVQVAPTKYTADQDELYREFDRSREAVTTMRAYTNGNATREKFEQLYRDRGADLALHESLAKAIEPISMISKQRRMLQSMPPDQMSREDRRKRIDELQATENKMIAEYMKQYRQIDRKEIQRKVDESLDRVGDEYDRSKGR